MKKRDYYSHAFSHTNFKQVARAGLNLFEGLCLNSGQSIRRPSKHMLR